MRRRRLILSAAGIAGFVTACPALSQSTAPSSITPPTLKPPPPADDNATIIQQTEGLTAPKGAEGLTVLIEGIDAEGSFAEVARETEAIVAQVVGRQVTLAQLYAVASAIEAAHARAGYVLARVAVPPQQITNGGRFRILVIDGFIESIDVSAVPERVRHSVAARAAALTGRRHLKIGEIERPLLLAGETPGLTLTSTLTRGLEQGGTRLLLSGRQRITSGSLSVENGFAPALGRFGVTAQASLNSAFGLGEQIYGFAVGGYDLPGNFYGDAPVRVLGGGINLAPGEARFSINPEVTFSRTQPRPRPGVPTTRGNLRRLSLRGGFVVEKSRRQSLSLSGAIEQIRESNDAIDFGARLSLDRFMVGRLSATYSAALSGGGSMAASAQVSQGLGGLDSGALPASVLPSRQGAATDFTKATLAYRIAMPIGAGFEFRLAARGQTSFGRPLFRSEQTALEGNDGVSAYVGGETAVDAAIVTRAQLARHFAFGRRKWLRLSPVLFGAAGKGWIERATAVERPDLTAINLGAGLRGAVPKAGLGFSLEYARGVSAVKQFNDVDRVAISASTVF